MCCVLEIVIDKFQMVSSSTPIKMNIIHKTAFPQMLAEMPNSEKVTAFTLRFIEKRKIAHAAREPIIDA